MIDEILSGDDVAVDNSNQPVVEAPEKEIEVEVEGAEKPENQENNAEGESRKKRPSGFQRKISKLEQAVAERDARIAELTKSTTATLAPKKPTLDDYGTYDEFLGAQDSYYEALTDYKAKKAIEEYESSKTKRKEQEELATKQREVEQSWEDKIDALDENYDDFDEVMDKYKTTMFRTDLVQAIRESDSGPQLQYHLAKNPELLEKLNSKTISSFAIYKELAKVESQLASKPAVKVSKSSEPITPVKGTSRTAVSLEKLDTSSYIAQRYPHLYKRR